ncbi:MAG: HEAT repeat domain-containing protein [Coriobacteriia bacterium]
MKLDRTSRIDCSGGTLVVTGNDTLRCVETVVRSLSTAVKTLRLYPPSSPIPQQAMESAAEALQHLLASHAALPLVVARDGFNYRGEMISCPGSSELAGLLTSHEIAEVDFLPGCSTGEIAILLAVLLRDPSEIREAGGAAAAISLSGSERVIVSEVALTTAAPEAVQAEADIDSFLRELAGDERKLAAWLAAAAAGDPAALSDGVAELARAVSPGGLPRLQEVLGGAFVGQGVAVRDTLIGLALNDTASAPVLQGMLKALKPHDFASSLTGGMYAKNMLSVSNVLNTLTLDSSLDGILAELKPLLEQEGHTERELTFLTHMLDARAETGRQIPLADRVPDFQRVADFAKVGREAVESARSEIGSSNGDVNGRTVTMMLSLLEQQSDFDLWSKTLGNLAALVPVLLADGDISLADHVLADLANREARTNHPWPGIPERMREAMERATTAEAMSALAAAAADPAALDNARSILRRVDRPAQQRFLVAALSIKDVDGLALAEHVLGRRLVDLLAASEADLSWFHAGTAAARLSLEQDQRALQALDTLAHRQDQRARQEVARGLGASPSAHALHTLVDLARDPALEVAVAAVRSLGRTTALGAAAQLERLFDDIDAIGKDFPLAREVLGSLARTPDPGATSALERIAGQRALIKRGHFAEIQDLARQALTSRKGGVRS